MSKPNGDPLAVSMAALLPDDLRAVDLVYRDRRSHREAAVILDISARALGTSLMRAFRTIAAGLEPGGPTPNDRLTGGLTG